MAAVSVKRSIFFISMNYFFYSSTNIFSLRFTSKYAYIIFRILFLVSDTKNHNQAGGREQFYTKGLAQQHFNIPTIFFLLVYSTTYILIFTVYITI